MKDVVEAASAMEEECKAEAIALAIAIGVKVEAEAELEEANAVFELALMAYQECMEGQPQE